LTQYQSRAGNPQGYQRFDLDLEHKLLIPKDKLEIKANLLMDFLRKIVPGKTVLDIGCDKGYFSHLASELGAKNVTANDVSVRPLHYAYAMFNITGKRNVEVLRHNLFAEPLDLQFDLVLALAMIHQTNVSIEDSVSVIRKHAKVGAVIEFCEDYKEKFGESWNSERFSEAVLARFKSMVLIGEYDAIGDYSGRRYLWYCEV
jgi:2-polyprenyl-3-methyl-5-hydroxy-6-metoxy-1,4-benzoquinol methylase